VTKSKYAIQLFLYKHNKKKKSCVKQQVTVSLVMSVCLSFRLCVLIERLGSDWLYFQEIWYFRSFTKYAEKLQVSLKSYKNNGTLHEDECTFSITSHSLLPRMRNVSDKICRANQYTFYVQFLFFDKSAVYEIMWTNIVETNRPQTTIWHVPFAFWILKATNTLSE
jgi:hypothetical protein